MKKQLLTILLLLSMHFLHAQIGRQLPVNNNNPDTKKPGCILGQVVEPAKITNNDFSNAPHPSRNDDVYTIPVVFHNVYGSGGDILNIDEAAALVNGLNKSFSLKDPRFIAAKAAGKIPQHILDIAVDTKIQFCIAHTDPNGKATSGIINKFTGHGPVHFSPYSEKLYDDKLGGSTLWPKTEYINIYLVENLSIKDAAGYVDGLKKGIVLDKDEQSASDFSYIIAHEMGHYLSLPHLWGGKNGSDKELNKTCDKDDDVDDTPKQYGPSSKHKDYPNILPSGGYSEELLSCDNESDGGNQYLNFMDYTRFAMIFTKGQKDKMRKYIEDKLPGLLNNGKCNIGTCANDEYDQKADNKDFSNATLLNPEEYAQNGAISTKGHYFGLMCEKDVDVYKCKSNAGSKLGIEVRNLYDDSKDASYLYKLKVEVYKKTGEEYKPVVVYHKSKYSTSFFINEIQTGNEEYYVKIAGLTPEDFHPYVPYILHIAHLDAKANIGQSLKDCHKKDGDGSILAATIVDQPKEFESDICSAKDVDFYKVYLSGDANLETMSNSLHVTLTELATDLDMTIYDADGMKVGDLVNKKGTEDEVIALQLPKGWYYIQVKSKADPADQGVYTLIVDFDISFSQGVEAELFCKGSKYEPNETLLEAVPIDLITNNATEQVYMAKDYICPSNDNDMYKLKLDYTSDVTIHLYGYEEGNKLPQNYNLYLTDENNAYYYSQNEYTDWEKIIVKDLKPGNYIVQVMGQLTTTYDNEKPYYVKVYVTKKEGKVVPNDKPIVNLYPNPPKDNVTISISNKLTTKTAQLIITDLYGKVFTNKTAAFVNGNLASPVNVTNLPKGLYTVTIKDIKTGQQYHKRLAKE